MIFDDFIKQIETIDPLYLNNKHSLLSFITHVPNKYLTLTKLNIPTINKLDATQPIELKTKFLMYEYTLIWDCEFQVFSNKGILYPNLKDKGRVDPNLKDKGRVNSNLKDKHNCKFLIKEAGMIRCISELGLILLLNIKGTIYIGGLFHCSFLNHKFNTLNEHMPFYHEYMSVSPNTEKKIINIEQQIFPHLSFMNIWTLFIDNKNQTVFTNNLTKLLQNKKLVSNNQILNKFKDQMLSLLTLLENLKKDDNILNDNILTLVTKINTNLKGFIYLKLIRKYHKTHLFKQINDLYLNDSYIKSITVPIVNHDKVLINFMNSVKFSKCLNIIKGFEDLKALNNHALLLNCVNQNIIINNDINYVDIADYNDDLYKKCGSAKLYETYLCLMKYKQLDNETWIRVGDALLKNYMKLNMKPHNPLVDAYYTLIVYMAYNI